MKERFVDVGGHHIRYLEGGDPADGTMVLLHGLGGSAERWDKVSPIFEKRFRVVVPDMIGFGLSDKPPSDYTPDFLTSFLGDFVRATCGQRIFLVGSSLGGQVAVMYAASHPASIDRLVLVSPAGTMKRTTPAFDLYMMAAMYPGEQSVSRAFEAMEASDQRADADLVRGFIKRMRLPNAKMAFMSAVLGLSNSGLTEAVLHSISSPTLLVWGEDDPVVPIQNAGFFLSSVRDCTMFRMKGCGHTPYVQSPETFAKRVLEFLGSPVAG